MFVCLARLHSLVVACVCVCVCVFVRVCGCVCTTLVADEISADIVAVGRGQKKLTKAFVGSAQHKPNMKNCSVTQYISAVSKQLELEVRGLHLFKHEHTHTHTHTSAARVAFACFQQSCV